MGTYKSKRLSATEIANKPKLWSKLYREPNKKPDVSIDELPSNFDLVIVRAQGWWYIDITDNILKTKITSNKDGVSTFKEAFKDAVDQIPKN